MYNLDHRATKRNTPESPALSRINHRPAARLIGWRVDRYLSVSRVEVAHG
jgi:hypothetical protein